jgi:hypothetical protein
MKEIIINLFIWVGDATRSIQITRIVNGIFIALFLNTGFIILLANANLKNYGLPMFHGPFDDYDPVWYSQVGFLIVKTMIINSILPYT